MTGPAIPVGRLPGHLRTLVGRASLVALVPVGSAPWAAETAWEVARQAARLGRRTLLVDCFVDAPQLHAAGGSPEDDGIVDAFEYGASLNRIAQRQGESELYFVPTGTFATDPAELLANPRWTRLAAGFRHEGALLALYVPSAALPAIVNWIDAILVLAPEGFEFDRDAPGGLVEAEQAGRPMTIVNPGPPAPDTAFEPEAPFATAAAGPFELAPDGTADAGGLAFELVPDAGDAASPPAFDLAVTGATGDEPAFDLDAANRREAAEAVTFDLPAVAADERGGVSLSLPDEAGADESGLSLDLPTEPAEEVVDLPAELVPEAGGADTGRISLQLPMDEAVWQPPPPPSTPAGAPAQPVGYAPTAFEEPEAVGYAPSAFDQPPPAEPAEEPPTAPEPAPADEPKASRRTRPPLAELDALRAPQRTRRTLLWAVGFIVAVWLILFALRPEWVLPIGQPEAQAPPPPRPGVAREPDSLPFVVQVSAWNDLPHALEAMDTLAARGVRAMVTPLRVAKGISWRVQAGPFATMAEAELLLDTLRAHSLADPDGSVAVPLPLSFRVLPADSTPAGVRAERDTLRALGVAAFLLAEPEGGLRVYAGAFEHPDETQVLDSILFTLGRARRLGTRVGFLP